ncbi:acetyl-CoA carboxylase biotin carboxyl carrier protein subunit [Chloroflexi bacterium TSY]|nr:acetyl-CoA carboxylase biotin carboxyl carrier protein subunit [Chloroflexi bacterium TSY]
MIQFQYEVGDEQFTVTIHPSDKAYQITIGERVYHVQGNMDPNGELNLTLNGKRFRAYAYNDEDSAQSQQRAVWMQGRVWTLERPSSQTLAGRAQRRRDAQPRSGALTATMPGQVQQILVTEDEMVSRGAPLVILEAMKMEMRVTAPQDGRIIRIQCKIGDVVERGQLLIEMGE